MQLSRLDRQTRASLYSAISCQNADVQEFINRDASEAIGRGLTKYGKRRLEGEGSQKPSSRPRLDQDDDKIGKAMECESRLQ